MGCLESGEGDRAQVERCSLPGIPLLLQDEPHACSQCPCPISHSDSVPNIHQSSAVWCENTACANLLSFQKGFTWKVSKKKTSSKGRIITVNMQLS